MGSVASKLQSIGVIGNRAATGGGGGDKVTKMEQGESVSSASVKDTAESSKLTGEKNNNKTSTESGSQRKTRIMGPCEICGTVAKTYCSVCNKAFYCGRPHQLEHWKRHKVVCYPCIEMSPEEHTATIGSPFGRGPFMKASKDIKLGDTIYVDEPIMTGPGCSAGLEYEPLCLGCSKPVSEDQRCPKCTWPLCPSTCEKNTLHQTYECAVFQKNGVKELYDKFQYDLVRILRCILTSQKDPSKFDKLASLDVSVQDPDRRNSHPDVLAGLTTVRLFITKNCNLKWVTDETIQHMHGVVDIFTFVTGEWSSSMQIFKIPTQIAHSCSANSRYVDVIKPAGVNFIKVIATRDIKKGEPITQCLLPNLEPTIFRQQFLHSSYYYLCSCALCIDRTENGTFFSAIKCFLCLKRTAEKQKGKNGKIKEGGYLLPDKPTKLLSTWSCSHCEFVVDGEAITKLLDCQDRAYLDYRKLVRQEPRSNGINQIREKIASLEKKFHPKHYVIWRLKQLLVRVSTTCMIHDLIPPATWKEFRIMQDELNGLADDVMRMINLHQPGLTLFRARNVYDLCEGFWTYIQWAVIFGVVPSFKDHPDYGEFLSLSEEVVIAVKTEIGDVKKLVEEIYFMREHTEFIMDRLKDSGHYPLPSSANVKCKKHMSSYRKH